MSSVVSLPLGPTVLIEPQGGAGSTLRSWREAWAYRHLFGFFALRDIQTRYKQTMMGFVWVVLQPILEMVVLSIVFGEFFQTTSDGIPYPLFVFCGLLPWTAFANSVMSATSSVIANTDVIKRVYFPRFLVPVASSFGKTVDVLIAFIVLLGMMTYYGYPIEWDILLVPPILFFLFLTSAAVALFLSSLNAIYRDTSLMLPYFLRIGMLLTPVIYPVRVLGQPWQFMVELNPLSGFIEALRRILLHHQPPSYQHLAVSCGVAVVLFVCGVVFFQKMERRFLDLI